VRRSVRRMAGSRLIDAESAHPCGVGNAALVIFISVQENRRVGDADTAVGT
jgi:hypothetical protein